MKANELMVGDWVRIKDYPMIPEPRKMCAEYYSRSLVDIEPIPITEEILKANGFFWNDNEKIHVLGNPSKYFIIDNNLETSIGVGYIIKINHVHELQHALRLCGLNDLADNFKLSTTE